MRVRRIIHLLHTSRREEGLTHQDPDAETSPGEARQFEHEVDVDEDGQRWEEGHSRRHELHASPTTHQPRMRRLYHTGSVSLFKRCLLISERSASYSLFHIYR